MKVETPRQHQAARPGRLIGEARLPGHQHQRPRPGAAGGLVGPL